MDHIPELLREIERLQAVLWAWLTMRSNPPDRTEDRRRVAVEAAEV